MGFSAKILIIDDEPEMRALITTILTDQGYACLSVSGGEEGIRAAVTARPDLIICDLNMPRLNGIETCHILRRIPATGTTPIIMLTVMGDYLSQLRGFQEGKINDYIVKPFAPGLLLARVRALLEHTAAVRQEYARVTRELDAQIAELQRRLGEAVADIAEARRRLPNVVPRIPVISGLDIAALYRPCERIGGDFYEILLLAPERLGIFIGQVQEYGIQAAVLQSVLRKSIKSLAPTYRSCRECLLTLNQEIHQEFAGRTFVSLFYAMLDINKQEIWFARGGHCPPVLYSPSRSQPLTYLESPGTVLGVSANEFFAPTIVERRQQLKPHDLLLFYTDGFWQARNAAGVSYGSQRVSSVLAACADQNAATILQRLENDFSQFRTPGKLQEDVTIFCMKILQR